MFKNLLTKKSGCVLGIEIRANSMAVVVSQTDNGASSVSHADVIEFKDNASAGTSLKQWVHSHKLNGSTCNIVISQDDYQILLVEAPDVEDKELRNAIRWRLKDLLNTPVEKAVIDVFALPQDGARGNKKMVYVVAAESDRVKDLVEMVRISGLSLSSIDITELAIRNVTQQLVSVEGSERGIVIVRIQQASGSIFIYRQGNMYLARSFSINYNGGLIDDLPEDTLALELQRSLDYYERQMAQSPPSAVYLCGENISDSKIGPTFRASIAVQLQVFDPCAIVSLPESVSGETINSSLAALGASLRAKVLV